jgi:hypothetical protein
MSYFKSCTISLGRGEQECSSRSIGKSKLKPLQPQRHFFRKVIYRILVGAGLASIGSTGRTGDLVGEVEFNAEINS